MSDERKWQRKTGSSRRRMTRRELGQILPIVVLMMAMFFCLAGFSIDIGRVYIAFHELQASTDAAALAGGEAMAQSGQNAATVATQFSSVSGKDNANGLLAGAQMVTGYPKPECLATLKSSPYGIPCYGNGGTANAIQVKQTIALPTTFLSYFWTRSVTLTATSTAAMAGAPNIQYNVALIVDTTASMNDTDSSSQCSSTRLACSLNGVQTLLGELYPCAISGCGGSFTTGEPTNAFDHVSLFTFPNVPATTVTNDTNCTGTAPSAPGYSFPPDTAGLSGYTAITPSGGSTLVYYQVTPYLANFRPSNTSSGSTLLNGSSPVVDAVGGKSGCSGMAAPGGAGTYYAAVIYAAQQSLVAESTLNPNSQNVIILISDGDASSGYVQNPVSSPNNKYSTYMPGASLSTGTYPSVINQCHQAITAAEAAATAGTKVFSIAYGAESSGCATDQASYPGWTPCQTMQAIASSPSNFYSDYSQSGGGVDGSCVGAGDPTSSITQIFSDIASSFTAARLIPDGMT